MTHILHLDSSIMGDNSVSRKLSAELLNKLSQAAGTTSYRDLGQEKLPLLDAMTVGQLFHP